MAAGQANGRPKAPNGHLIGKGSTPVKSQKKSSFVGWVLNNAARCPASLEEVEPETSRVCAPYLQVRAYLDPYAKPYYQHYVEPYASVAKPYYDQFHQLVYIPVATVGKANYEKYGAPQVQAAQEVALDRWEKLIKPQLDVLTAQAKEQYDQNLAPHVEKVTPYYETTKDSVQDIYSKQVLPAYQAVQPHVNTAVSQAQKHWTEIGKPYSAWALSTSWSFLDRTVWPKLRILYGENVEPQIIRITERLGRYRDEQKLKAAVEDAITPPSQNDPEGINENPAHSVVSSSLADEATTAQSEATPISETEEEREARLKTSIETDLKKWQASWEKATNRGTEDLKERVEGIAKRQTASQVEGVGRALITQLEETTASETSKLKSSIVDIVQSLGEELTEEDLKEAEEKVATAARSAGKGIRTKAQSIRSWHEKFIAQTQGLIEAAASSTLEVIDRIRNHGLQETEKKWTNLSDSNDAYADWSRYHFVYTEFVDGIQNADPEVSRKAIEDAALEHPAYVTAKAAAEDLEAIGMAAAEDAAKELLRLKTVGVWKVQAQDDSDDFSTKTIPAKAKVLIKKASEAIEQASANIIGTSQGTVESVVSEASKSAASAASAVSANVVGTEPGVVEQASKAVSEAVIGTEQPIASSVASAVKSSAASVASVVAEKVEAQRSALSDASESIIGSSTPAYESAASAAASSVQSVVSQAKEAVVGSSTPAYESAASEAVSSVKSAASGVSEAVVGSSTGIYESVTSEAASSLSEAASIANSIKDSIQSVASASGNSLHSAASEAVVGSETPAIEKAASAVSSAVIGSETPAYESVASQVSEAVVGSEVPIHEQLAAQISKAAAEAAAEASEGASKAAETVSSAAGAASDAAADSMADFEAYVRMLAEQAAAAGEAESKATASTRKVFGGAMAQKVTGRVPVMDEDVEDVKDQAEDNMADFAAYISKLAADASNSNYKNRVQSALEAANSRYGEMTKAVSEALLEPSATPGALDNIQEVIEQRYASAMKAASEALYGKEPSVGEQVADAASSRYTDAVSAASSIFFGTPTPAVESLQSAAQGQYESARSVYSSISDIASSRLADSIFFASEQYENIKTAVGATPTPAHQKYLDEAQKKYYEGVGLAHERYSSFVKSASVAVYGTPKPEIQKQYEDVVSKGREQYRSAAASASVKLSELSEAIKTASGAKKKSKAQSAFDEAKLAYDQSLKTVGEKYRQASEEASRKLYGAPTGSVESVVSVASKNAESVVSQASANWEELVSKASVQFYGEPTAWYESLYTQAGEYGAQATSQAAEQYAAVAALFSELVQGKEADYTDSVMSRLSSAYYTGIPQAASSVSSVVSAQYASATDKVKDEL